MRYQEELDYFEQRENTPGREQTIQLQKQHSSI
jgi:hypothetical protein